MTHMPQSQGFAAGGFDRRVRTDRRRGDRRRLSIAVPVDRRAQDRRSNQGRRITEWFGETGSEPRGPSGRRTANPTSRISRTPRTPARPKPAIEVLPVTSPPQTALETCTPEVTKPQFEVNPPGKQESATLAPSFTSLAFRHHDRPYSVEAVEEASVDGRSSTWHWRVMVNGVVEHTLRAMPHEDRNSLETRAIRTIEETAAGAVRELNFEYEGKRYHLEDRSDKLRRDSSGDTGMWCVTCDGVMEGSFQAKAGEREAILRARAIQIARRSGEYQATLRSNRPTRGRALRQHLETPPRTRPSQPSAAPPRATPPAVTAQNIPAQPPAEGRTAGSDAQYHQIRPEDFQAQPQPEPAVVPEKPRARATMPRMPEPRDAEFRRPARRSSPEFFTQPIQPASRRSSGATQRITGPITGRISGPTVAAARPEPSTFNTLGTQLANAGRSSTRAALAIVKGTFTLLSVLALAPIYAFRSGNRPRHRSRLVRATQDWVEAVPVRMLVPYAAGAALALGIVPVNATIWAAGGMAVLLFPVRVKGHTERFQIAEHTFDRTRTVVPTVEVHKKQGLDDPRRVTRRRRGTSSHRLLRSSGR